MSDDNNTYALNATTGAELWNYRIGSYGAESSPAVANGVVYVSSGDGIYAIGNGTATALNATATATKNFTVCGNFTSCGKPLAGKSIILQRSTDNKTWTNVTPRAANTTNVAGADSFSRNETASGVYYYPATYAGNAARQTHEQRREGCCQVPDRAHRGCSCNGGSQQELHRQGPPRQRAPSLYLART